MFKHVQSDHSRIREPHWKNSGKLITKGMIDQISGQAPNLAAAGGGKTKQKIGKDKKKSRQITTSYFFFVYMSHLITTYLHVHVLIQYKYH